MSEWPAEALRALSEASGHTLQDAHLIMAGLHERGYIIVPLYAVDNLPPIHAGQFLKNDLDALNMSIEHFAARISVPTDEVVGIIDGNPIKDEMAIRLSVFFGTTTQYWHNLQAVYDAKRRPLPP